MTDLVSANDIADLHGRLNEWPMSASFSFYHRFSEIITALFILLFTYTAISKALDFATFKNVLAASPLVSKNAGLIALGIPVTELFVAAVLFIPNTRLLGLYLALCLMILFTLYLGYMILYTPHLPCSCGGVLKQMTWHQHIIFNMIFILLAMLGIVFKTKHQLFIAINRHSRKPV